MRTIQHKGHEYRLVYETSSVFLTQATFSRILDFACGVEVLTFTRYNLSIEQVLEIEKINLSKQTLNLLINQLSKEDKTIWKTV